MCVALPNKAHFSCTDVKDPEKHCHPKNVTTQKYTFETIPCTEDKHCASIRSDDRKAVYRCSSLQDEPFEVVSVSIRSGVPVWPAQQYKKYIMNEVTPFVKLKSVSNRVPTGSGICLPTVNKSIDLKMDFPDDDDPLTGKLDILYIPRLFDSEHGQGET